MIRRVLVGGTASGKKLVAAELALRHGWRLLSMDSMKVYRGMDIGTDKPDAALRARVPFALLDLVGHDQSFDAARWVAAAKDEVATGAADVLFAGGTPFYLKLLVHGLFVGPGADAATRVELDALWENQGEAAVRVQLAAVDPVIEARLSPGDRKRLLRALEVYRLTGRAMSEWQAERTERPIDGRFVVAALRHPPERHAARLAERVAAMFDKGLLDEVAALQARAPFALEPGRSIGYAEAREVLAGRMKQADAMTRVIVRTRQLVRRQRIFLDGLGCVTWVDVPEGASAAAVASLVEPVLEA